MYQVHNVMNKDVLTISTDVTVDEAIRCLIGNHISGMPVVDEEGRLVGIISEFQLLETLFSSKVREMLVRDVMTKDVLSVAPNTILSDATSLMVAHRIRRLPVVDNGKIVGIVSRRDLLRYTLEAGDKLDDYLDEIKACVCSSSSA
jgi:CBS domain-containing protein